MRAQRTRSTNVGGGGGGGVWCVVCGVWCVVVGEVVCTRRSSERPEWCWRSTVDVLLGRATTKTHQLDTQFCGTLDGDTGPIARRLNAFGPVCGLVVGHWAEG